MRLRSWLAVAGLSVWAVATSNRAAASDDGLVGIFTDLTATQTSATFDIGVPRTLYIVARLEGATTQGITGAEFRVDGMPAGWLAYVTPAPAANITLGDPFQTTGVGHRANIVFPYCQGGIDGCVLLYTVVVVATSEVGPTELVVEGGDPPTNPNVQGPVLIACNIPTYSQYEAERGRFLIGVRAPHDLDYSQRTGYDGRRGVVPERGLPGDLFCFRAAYTSADESLPAAGWPRLELDVNGDNDTDDPGEGVFTMSPADQDSTLANGREYRYDVALGAPAGGRYRYRMMALSASGDSVPGLATAWRESLLVGGPLVDIEVHAEGIQITPSHPNVGESCAIRARIDNRGDGPAEDIAVTVRDVFGNTIAVHAVPYIGPRASTEIVVHWRFADFGFQPVVVRAVPGGGSIDCDPADNQASHAAFVGGITISGHLSVGGLPPVIYVSPVAPFGVVGTTRYLLAGSLPAAFVQGGRVVVRPEWDAAQIARTDSLGHFPADLVSPAASGTYRLSFTVNDGACTDSAVVSVQVAPVAPRLPPHGPNLVMQLVATPGPGCPPSTAAIEWWISNRGDRPSEPSRVRLLTDGVTTAFEAPVASLPPSAVLTLGPLGVPLGPSGLHALTAHVDPASTLHELREDDNVATASIRVQPGCMDLALEVLHFTGSRVCAGESVGIEVQVANRGCQPALAARVVLRNDMAEIGSAALPALGPGETTSLSFAPVLGAASCQGMTLQLDPEGQAGADCDATSNELSTSACAGDCDPPPPPPPPDFSVSACEIESANPRPASGDSVRFRATIHNRGFGNSTALALVRFELGSVPVGDPVPLGALAVGEARVVESSAGWAVQFTPTQLRVTVDPNGQVEGTTFDNGASRPLPYELRLQNLPACPPGTPSMFSTCSPCLGEPFDVRAVILNSGLFECDSVRVEFRDVLEGNAVLGAAVAPVVAAGSACASHVPLVSTSIILTQFAGHSIAAVVDPANEFPEVDETNNTYSASVTVACGVTPDLVAVPVMPAGPEPVSGDTVRAVDVVVFNRGTAAADSVQARLSLGGEMLDVLEVGDLAPGDSNTVVCTAPWVMAAGCSQVLQACADPDDRILEVDEYNNCTSLNVGCGPMPDLVTSAWLPGGVWPAPGDTVRAVEVSVTNQGEVWAGAVQARLTLDGVVLCDLEMGDLAPGAWNTAVCTTPWVAAAFCNQHLEACADPQNAIEESNETNNCEGVGGAWPATDVALYAHEIRVDPPNPGPGQSVYIQVTVFSLQGVESMCTVRAEWGRFDDQWWPIGEVPLHVPADYYYIEDAVSFVWTMPPFDVVQLRFRLVDICPPDIDPWNNEALGTLPWYVPPYTPVVVSDFGLESTAEGVAVRWRSDSAAAVFALERRREGAGGWQRLADPMPVEREPGAVRYEVLDRTAEPGARLEYRLLARGAEGEEMVATGSVVHAAALPQSLVLHPVRPNPFRPGGTIEYSVPEPRTLDLCVYDAAGRRLASLRSGMQPAGRHAVTWNGRDDSGQRVPAGVYFCRLVAGGFVATQRIVLVH